MDNETDALEMKLRLAESILAELGAVPADINARNRRLLGQRQSYLHNGTYYRIDHAEFDGAPFIILSCADSEKLAAIGLMEDVEAVPLDADPDEIRRVLRGALQD